MQIPIINGIYTDEAPDYRASYPKNLIPVPKQTGISSGYLRPSDGLMQLATTPALDRGGINWNGVLYRAIGTKLVKVEADGIQIEIGEIGGDEQVTFAYSFDRLAVASNLNLFYWDNTTFQQVTDPDLLDVIDLVWIDGYFMTTDGEFIVVTELNDPLAVDPLKYGSSEASPDPIKALLKLKNEVYALNRYTIEVFDNIGTSGFPFQRIEGALIDRGTLGTHTCVQFLDTIAFLGSGREEAPAIWMGNNSSTVKISTREIDQILLEFTEEELSETLMETKVEKSHRFLYVHLPNRTLVYDGVSSQLLQQPVWFVLSSSLEGFSKYRCRNMIYVYDRWIFGDPTSNQLGYFVDNISTHYRDKIEWEFGTSIFYNDSNSAIFHELELVGLFGRVPLGIEPVVWTDYSTDGETWSNKKPVRIGNRGQRNKRLVWFRQGFMRNVRMQRFRGTSDAHISIARLEALIEPLNA